MYNSAIRMFESTAARLPDKTAVISGESSISFGDLRTLSRKIGTLLLKTLAGRCGYSPVIIYLPKGIEALACQLGAQYSANPYVPVDANVPLLRLQTIVNSIGQGVIITDAAHAPKLDALQHELMPIVLLEDLGEIDDTAIDRAVAAVISSDPCYIIFTSGSTGVPKGVTIPHRGVVDYAQWLAETFHYDETTVLGNESNFYFDNSVLDISTMCYTGATLNLIPEVLFRYPVQLMDYVEEHEITSIFFVPTVMISIANSGTLEGRSLEHLKTVLFAGEVMPNRELNVWRRNFPHKVYANLYGPTESTDVCIYYIVDREFADTEPLPIGVACDNMRVLILNEQDQPCPVGETGEICIFGSGVALGYWNNPEQTQKVFVANPCNSIFNDRMYRTGDLGYWMEDGNIGFVGRKDFQIKRRGNRIELGDIETAARSIEASSNACALYDPKKEDIILCLETSEALTLRKVNACLRKLIPAFMLPTRLECIPALPHTANGKINRLELKKMIGVD